MSTTQVPLTPERAVAVMNAAAKCHMFDPARIPESDGDKITEAEKLIALALQAKIVVDQVGASNVPTWPFVRELLLEGGALDGDQPSPPIQAATPPGGSEAFAAAAQPTPAPEAQVAQQELPPPPAALEPQAAQPFTQPQKSEFWVDANGAEWEIMAAGGGPQVEAKSVQTGETTVLPVGFLKHISAGQRPEQQPAIPPQPTVQELPPSPPSVPSSAPASPPSPSPTPTTEPAAAPTPSASPSVSPEPITAEPAAPPSTLPSSEPSGSESQAPSSPSSPPEASSSPGSAEEPRHAAQIYVAPIDDDEGDEEYGKVLDEAVNSYQPTGMPAPMDLERPPEEMPDDLTTIDNISARRLHSQFNALASRARYLRGLEAAKARACSRQRQRYLKPAMREARGQLGKDASVTEVQHLAEDDASVATWTERQDRHGDRAEAYETFFKLYSEDVSVLSRDWTMRSIEESGS